MKRVIPLARHWSILCCGVLAVACTTSVIDDTHGNGAPIKTTPETDEALWRDRLEGVSIGTLGDGIERPGGPVNRPVTGEQSDGEWNALSPNDLVGEWTLTSRDGFAQCEVNLGGLNAAGSGTVIAVGACPFAEGVVHRWRYADSRGQIEFLTASGESAWRANRRGDDNFVLYAPRLGWLAMVRRRP